MTCVDRSLTLKRSLLVDPKNQAIIEAALSLPETDRIRLAEQLLATLSPDVTDSTEDAWAAELDRRWEEYHQDPAAAVPWSDLKHESLE
jgi:putative addiction module component (TIGR02574 family)